MVFNGVIHAPASLVSLFDHFFGIVKMQNMVNFLSPMKKTIFTFFSFLLMLTVGVGYTYAQGSHKARQSGSTSAPFGYYEYLPTDYSGSSKEFPLLIFLHGAGERGDGKGQLDRAVKFGPGREINNGKDFSFVVLSPQSGNYWSVHELDNFIEYAKKEYNIDEDRIYLTGLSMGAMGLLDYLEKHPEKIAAVVPIAGSGDPEKVCGYSDVPLWAFHGDRDQTVPISGSKNIVNSYNNCKPVPNPAAKLTVMHGKAHWGWNDVYDGSLGDIYSWMLRYSADGEPEEEEPAPNKAPQVNAGKDKSVKLPGNSLELKGSATDSDGRIVSYNWTKVKGPSVKMENSESSTLQLSSLVEGTYTFKLSAKDNGGAWGQDEVKVVVKPEDKENKAPLVMAGKDRTLKLPENSLRLEGSASDEDGHIVSYKWVKVKGPSATMEGRDSQNLQLKDLKEGNYTFSLTAKDNGGAEAKDQLTVIVKPAPKENKAPVAKAGSDHTVKLPLEELVLSGSGKDKDGELVAFSWKKTGGPSVNMKDASTANLRLSQLKEGTYKFLFTVEDNDGATDSDEVKVKVKAAPEDEPQEVSITAYAGKDEEVQLPLPGGLIIHGSARLRNGSIRSYRWEKVSGPSLTIKSNKTANLEIKDLKEGVYTFRFTATAASGDSDSDEMKIKVRPAAASDGGSEDAEGVSGGLTYAYYEIAPSRPWSRLPDFSDFTPVKTGTVSEITVSPREQDDYYAFTFDGYIDIDEAGTYFFYTDSDEGSRLYINDRLVVDNDGVHENKVEYSSVELGSGMNKIRVEYFENKGNEKLFVSYKGPGVPLQKIPEEKLYNSGQAPVKGGGEQKGEMVEGLAFSYYENQDPDNDAWYVLPDFDGLKPEKSGRIAGFTLEPRQRDDHFGFVFEGLLKVEKAGYYTFYLNSDDGSKLFVNNRLLIDNDGWHAPFEKAGSVQLEPGYHPIRLTYYEHEELEVLEVKWEGDGFARQTIPASVLYHKTAGSGKAAMASASKKTGSMTVAGEKKEKPQMVSARLYPNPAQDQLNLQLSGLESERVTLTILDGSGRKIHSRRYNQSAAGQDLRLDLSEMQLVRGTYLMVIENEARERIKTMRFIKN